MNRALFLGINGAVQGGRQSQCYQPPKKTMILNSIRFGRHAYIRGGTIQLLPLGNEARPLEPAAPAAWRRGAGKVLDLLSNRKRYLLTLLQ
jgi:hypothetical protein